MRSTTRSSIWPAAATSRRTCVTSRAGLVVSIPLNQAMLLGDDRPASRAALNGYVEAGADAFLRAYGVD
jgi:hypothetical protein